MNSINLTGLNIGNGEKQKNGSSDKNEKEDQKQEAQRDAFVKLLSKFIR